MHKANRFINCAPKSILLQLHMKYSNFHHFVSETVNVRVPKKGIKTKKENIYILGALHATLNFLYVFFFVFSRRKFLRKIYEMHINRENFQIN